MRTPLIAAAALMNAAMVSASAMSTIVVADRIGPGAGGLPNTAGVLGTAAGAVLVGRLTQLRSRPVALRIAYAGSSAGGILTVSAVLTGQLFWLFAGMLLLGAGNAAALLSRYAAADLATPGRRAAAMGTVVWAGTTGAVLGPLLLEPSQRAAASLGLPATAGPFLIAAAATAGATVAISRFRPRPRGGLAPYEEVASPRTPRPGLPVKVAAAAVMTAQLVMVAVTTAVPVHAHHHGHGLGLLGLMLSVHTFGMFAFSPLTGWCVDRAGARPVAIAGVLLLVAAAVLVAVSAGGGLLTFALFTLGLGWNLAYVSGSAALSRAGGVAGRRSRTGLEGPRLESIVEAWAWTVSAVATALSTWLFSAGGFRLLAVVGLALLLPVLVALTARRPVPAPVQESVQESVREPVRGPVDGDSAVRRDAGTLLGDARSMDRADF